MEQNKEIKLKVTLINPNYEGSLSTKRDFIPLGIAYIAAVLRSNSIDVDVIDAAALDMTDIQLGDKIRQRNPDIVGITATTPIFRAAVNAAEIVKHVSNAITVIGGVHPTVLPNETIKNNAIDIVVRGEGEITTLELVRAIEQNRDLKTVEGIMFKSNGEIIATQPRNPINNLDSLPFPARDLFPFHLYRGYETVTRRTPATHIMTSRGCPFNCVFCASKTMWGKGARVRSPSNIVDEIEYLINKFHIREILLYDDTFNINLERAEAICDEIISRKLDISWKTQSRVYPLTEKLLRKMKESGCWCVYFGVESGDSEILHNLKKGITLEQVTKAFELTKRVGLRTVAYFMLGLPGDDEKTMKKTIEFAKYLDPDFAVFSITTVYPGTELFKTYINQETRDINDFCAPIIYETNNFNKEGLDEILSIAKKEFYFQPRYILQRFTRIRSWDEFLMCARAAYSML